MRDARIRQGSATFERQHHQQHNFSDFDYDLMAPPSNVSPAVPYDSLPETPQLWTNNPTDSPIEWTPTYVSSNESTSASSTVTDPSLYSAVITSQQTTPAPRQAGSVAASRAYTLQGSRESSQQRQLPHLPVDTVISQQPASIVQSLSTLNVRLHENASQITAQRTQKSGQMQQSRDQRSRSTSLVGHVESSTPSQEDLSIDETFRLSLDFIDALSGQGLRSDLFCSPKRRVRARSASAVSPSPAVQVAGPNSTQYLEIPQPVVDNTTTQGPRFDDQASVLLILSCYLRLINTFDDIFEHIQAVLEWPVSNDLQRLRLKRISVGVFSPPKDSLGHANLVLQMSEHLLTCARGKVKNAAACEDDDQGHIVREGDSKVSREQSPEAASNDVTKMTLLAIKVREVNIVNKLKRIRQSLHQRSTFL